MRDRPAFERHPFGFTSECWTDGVQFLKVWRYGPPPVNLTLLDTLAAADLPVPVAMASATIGGRACAVFPHVAGRHATDDDHEGVAHAMRRVHETPTDGLDVPVRELDDSLSSDMRSLLDHPWLRGRRDEVERVVERLEGVTDAARRVDAPLVLCHTDFGGWNLLIDEDTGRLAAILDWDEAALAPREDDVWVAFRHPQPTLFLDAYGRDIKLDSTLMERALLARAVADTLARLSNSVDREGIDLWGFDQWRKLDQQLGVLHAWRDRP